MSNFVFIFYCCIINNYKGGIQVKKAELLKLEEVMEFADEVVTDNYTKKDKKRAMQLMEAIKMIELELFRTSSKVNLFTEINKWGVEASYFSETMEYDIYIPELANKLDKVNILFPEECYLQNVNRKLIFIAAHKIRHRLQLEGEVSLFEPGFNSKNYLLNDIIEAIKTSEGHNKCSCSYLENPEAHQDMEFDAIVVQHFVLSRLKGFNSWRNLQDVPRYVWTNIAEDLLI